ncbi:MAG TPA: hypothetical protein VGW75_14745 [Solirubrobacteraceae bacterium]|nr:hypothetical protein [Solirubrobacteraceae bacterium]
MRLALAAVAAVLAAPAAARAQDVVAMPAAEARVVSSTHVPVVASGGLSVTWESDPAACAEHGRCGLDGVITWRVPRTGVLSVTERVVAGRRVREASLFFTEGLGTGSPLRARVRRATPDGSRLCTDATTPSPSYELEEQAGAVTLGLAQPGADELLLTRCAGPLLADVAPAAGALRVPLARLARGRTRLRIDGDGTFAAGGLRGHVSSALALRLGRPRRETLDRSRRRGRRFRQIEVSYRVAEVRGDVTARIAGSADPADCGPLDACGLAGTLRFAPALRTGSASLVAVAPLRAGRRALRAAVGVAPGPRLPRAVAFGVAAWTGPGRVETALAREGAPECADSVALDGGVVELAVAGTRVYAEYHGGPGRTRCPGPLLGFSPPTARGVVPRTALRARRVEIPLTAPVGIADQGWAGTTSSTLTVVLERTRVRESIERL